MLDWDFKVKEKLSREKGGKKRIPGKGNLCEKTLRKHTVAKKEKWCISGTLMLVASHGRGEDWNPAMMISEAQVPHVATWLRSTLRHNYTSIAVLCHTSGLHPSWDVTPRAEIHPRTQPAWLHRLSSAWEQQWDDWGWEGAVFAPVHSQAALKLNACVCVHHQLFLLALCQFLL